MSARGFTIVEILVAITVLTVGLLGFVGSSALITRMLGRGDRAATASFYAQERLELLQGRPCAALAAMANGNQVRGGSYQVMWTLTPGPANTSRRVLVRVRYPAMPGKMRTDSLETSVNCVR